MPTSVSASRTDPRRRADEERSDQARELFLRACTCSSEVERRASIDRVIEMHLDYAYAQASRYRMRGVSVEDLRQVAALALTRAAHRYDVTSGHDFMSYAAPTIKGELRKHFRDHGWMIRPARRVQELQARISTTETALSSLLGRSPRPAEIAEHLEVSLESVIEALATDGCFAPTSLDRPVGEEGAPTLGELLPAEDGAREALEARMVLGRVLPTLNPRDALVLSLRFDEGLTQSEIAAEVGVTQMQVSRMLTRILSQLRHHIGDVPTR